MASVLGEPVFSSDQLCVHRSSFSSARSSAPQAQESNLIHLCILLVTNPGSGHMVPPAQVESFGRLAHASLILVVGSLQSKLGGPPEEARGARA